MEDETIPTYLDLKNQIELLRQKEIQYRSQQSIFSLALNNIAEIIINNDNPVQILEKVNQVLVETLLVDRALIYYVNFNANQIIDNS